MSMIDEYKEAITTSLQDHQLRVDDKLKKSGGRVIETGPCQLMCPQQEPLYGVQEPIKLKRKRKQSQNQEESRDMEMEMDHIYK